jgi:hypothetical protein
MKLRLQNFHRRQDEAGDAGGDGGGAPAPAPAGDAGGTTLGGAAAPAVLEGAAPAAPAASTVTIPDNWKEALSEEFRNDPSMGAINNLESLAKSYIHSQKMIGKGKMSVPDQHASDSDWRQVFTQLGLPEKLDDYSFEVPETAQFEDGFVTELKKTAHELGILPRQMDGFVKWYSDANNEAIKTHEAQTKVQQQENMNALKQEWGQAFDQNINLAKSALKAADLGDQVYDWLNASGMGDDPNMIKILSTLGQMLKEDNLIGDFGETVAAPKELQSRVQELQQSPAYMDRSHPNHKAVLKEMEGIYQQLHPQKKDNLSQLT